MKKIYVNGVVYPGELPLVSAFAVENGVFVFAGSDGDARALCTAEDELVDLEGRFVCCGFNDSHMHLLNLGQSLVTARLDQHTGSLEDMIGCLRDFAEDPANRDTAVIMGRGWNQDYFSDTRELPTRWDLDRVSLTRPVAAVRACGHCMAVNSKFLEMLGLDGVPEIEGGIVGQKDGEPNGLFFDNAMAPVYDRIPAPNKAEIKRMLRAGCEFLNSFGVTSCQTDDLATFAGVEPETVLEAYRELAAEGGLTVRVYEQCNFSEPEDFRAFLDKGWRTGNGDDSFRIGPLKLLSDGALGPRTALLSVPYADDPAAKGLACFSQETLDELVAMANENNMQVACHTIGDGALDMYLSACEKALAACPRTDHRHGIVHCQITRWEQLDQIAELGLHVYAQTIFLDYDTRIVEPRVGSELADSSYRWKTLMNRGVVVSNGTDSPVEMPDALKGIQCAVTRASTHSPCVPYLPEEAFTVQEALDSYTSAGAHSSFEEARKGKMKNGMLADFTVLGENPFTAEKEHIREIPVLEAFLGGERVFAR